LRRFAGGCLEAVPRSPPVSELLVMRDRILEAYAEYEECAAVAQAFGSGRAPWRPVGFQRLDYSSQRFFSPTTMPATDLREAPYAREPVFTYLPQGFGGHVTQF